MKKSIIKVWTRAYRPFMFGGNPHTPVATRVWAEGPYDLGKGYSGYLVRSPNNSTHVAEATSGAFVGSTITAVRDDIRTGEVRLMAHQVKSAIEEGKKAQIIEPDAFWSLLHEN